MHFANTLRLHRPKCLHLAGRSESRPLFVLTSSRTFSGGEGLAFVLKERSRATIIGETTAGAANAGRPFQINEAFEATIPTGRVAGAVTGGNWEGTGVTPDARFPASDALKHAHVLAIRASLDKTIDNHWRDTLDRYLRAMEATEP